MKRVLTPLAVLASAMLLLTSCATGPANGDGDQTAGSDATATVDANAFPTTVKHALGETTIDSEPTRVVTIGWGDQDAVASLGVVPVGVIKASFGANSNDSYDWFDAKINELGGEQPVKLDTGDAPPYEEIAKLNPDLILATNSGVDAEQYKKLTEIAPTVANPGVIYTTSWQDSLSMVGQALGRGEEAKRVEADTKQKIQDAADAHPDLKDKTFIYGSVLAANPAQVYLFTAEDNRSRLLEELGMKTAPIVAETAGDDKAFSTEISSEKAATLESDVFVSFEDKDGLIADDKLLSQIPAVKKGALVAIGDDEKNVASVSIPSPLSIPVILEDYIPRIDEAVKAGE